MTKHLTHITDSQLTQAKARVGLGNEKIVVTWFTNRLNRQSVVHSHPYVEMILGITGQALYTCNGNLYMLHPGELITFPEDVYHYGKYDLGADISERLVVQIDGDFWRQIQRQNGLYTLFLEPEAVFMNSDAVSFWDLRGLFERMALCAKMRPDKRESVYKSQLSELQIILSQIIADNLVEKPTATNKLAAKAVDYLQRHYREPDLSVAQVAEYTYVSREHLSRIFKEYTAETIHNYITDLRMQDFRSAIADGKGILEASIESGFSNYSSFVKMFRKLYGISPMEYRNQLKLGRL